MKHSWKITSILLLMFLVAQFIGLYVVNQYSPIQQVIVNPETGEVKNITLEQNLPYGMQPPQDIKKETSLVSIIISFAIAILIVFLLISYKLKTVIKIWFFTVVILALGISFNSFLKGYFSSAYLISLAFAVPLAYLKVFRPRVIVHNFTELLIYPGIAAVFVPILSIWTSIILLILISIYDMWAVWHTGIMQKMAKFQMEEVGVFGGFFVPYLTKKIREKIQNLKKRGNKNKKIKINLAILGGGDVVFPIIVSGVFLRTFGWFSALSVVFGAFLGLLFLLLISEKKKFYPAMPFITAGIFFGSLVWALFSLILPALF